MKKIISKIFACLAVCVFALGAVSLVACGEKEDPAPTPPATVTSVANKTELATALAKGGSIKLTENITDIENTTYTIDKEVTLDLNGKSITATITDETRRDLFVIVGGKLTINDANNEGSITLNGKKENLNNGYVFNVGTHKKDDNTSKKGTLVINGGKFTTKNDVTVVQLTFGEVTINNGSFQIVCEDGNGNAKDGKTLMINRKNKDKYNAAVNYYEDVKLVINGGKFEGFNPNGDRANKEDETDADKNYLGENKEAVEGTGNNGAEVGWYIVQDKAAD